MAIVDVGTDYDCSPPRLVEPAFVVHGRVEGGDRRGRTLGVPTANLRLGDEVAFDDGVYGAVYLRPDGSRYRAAVSVGRRPTFYAAHGCRLLEAHLLGFAGSLVGEQAEVRLVWYVRTQRSFGSTAQLVGQLRHDIELVRSLRLPV